MRQANRSEFPDERWVRRESKCKEAVLKELPSYIKKFNNRGRIDDH